MRRWELAVALDQTRDQPLFLQLAKGIADDIQCGRLKPGDALPGSRELAQRLGVNRNTIVAGYDELAAEGLISTRIGGGTFVMQMPASSRSSRASRSVAPIASSPTPSPTYSLAPLRHTFAPRAVPVPGALMMSIGGPDARLFPARALARAFRRAIEWRGRAQLGFSGPAGNERLRAALATMLSHSRGMPASAENTMVTRSIEQAIDLVARTLITPGDVVAVESFGYPPAWNVLKLAGARLLSIPLDNDGLDIDALESVVANQPVRAVFLTPHHQFPTGTVMSAQRRARLAQLALQHRFAIIEDDYDHEFHYARKPILPIASGPAGGNVIYIGSLANLLAPGISSAFIVAPPTVFAHLLHLRSASDARSDVAMECAIAELFEDGELLRHVRRVRKVYEHRRDALAESLTQYLGSAVKFDVPDGGMGLWLRFDDAIDIDAWIRAGEGEGVIFNDARRYNFSDRASPFMRLGFCNHNEAEIADGVQRMTRALTRARSTRSAMPASVNLRDDRRKAEPARRRA